MNDEVSYVKIKVVNQEGKYLHHHYERDDVWDHPAGKIEEGEGAIDAAQRELFERTGYKVEKEDLVAGGIEEGDGEKFQVFMTTFDKLVKVQEPQTEIDWR